MSGDVWAGLDLGTSGLKGLLVDAGGRLLARARHGYPTARPEPGASEQDPADWTAAVTHVVGELLALVPAPRWAGIGLSAMLPTLVTTDADGRPTGPAVTWEDGRADDEGEAFRAAHGAETLYRRTGQWVDGRYLLPMWQRIRRTDPARASATRTLLDAKDFLLHDLTGAVATDPSTASGAGCFDLAAGAWAADLGAGAAPALPEVVAPGTAYPLAPDAAARLGLPAGLPVHVGAADSVLGALGLGVTDPGDVAYVAGTSTVVLGLAGAHVVDPAHRFLVTPTAVAGTWGLEMDLLATGAAIRWLAGILGLRDEAHLLALAATADPDRSPLVLPYVAPGEQGALWDPDLTGSVIGLDLRHGPADLALGLVLGILAESRRCVRVLESVLTPLGHERGPLRVAGGGVADPWLRRMLADATGREVVAPGGHGDHSAVGAAMVAAAAAGIVVPPGTDPGGADGPADVTSPDPGRADWWGDLAARSDDARSRVGHGLRSS